MNILNNIKPNLVVIFDECHNINANTSLFIPPDIPFVIGLSATPQRQYDEIGTTKITEVVGEQCYEYALHQAIGKSLTRYMYYPHLTLLNQDESLEYEKITIKIVRAAKRGNEEELSRLLILRRRILDNCESKIQYWLSQIKETNWEPYTLIYTSDKIKTQHEAVCNYLYDHNVDFSQLTFEETSQPRIVNRILSSFRDKSIKVLCAKRVLDEGFDIPEISTAYILASTTVHRQWIQRMGRLLRKSKKLPNKVAKIHDYIVLPNPEFQSGSSTRQIIKAELTRCHIFSQHSENAWLAGGGLALVSELASQYSVSIDA